MFPKKGGGVKYRKLVLDLFTTNLRIILLSSRYQQSIKYCALLFLYLRYFETDRYTQEKHEITSFELQEIYEFNFSFFVVSRFVPKLRKFLKKWSAQYIFDWWYKAL